MRSDGDTRPTGVCESNVPRWSWADDEESRSSAAWFSDHHRNTRPPCFNSEQEWEEWKKAANAVSGKAQHYCADCLPYYAKQMRAAGRCGHTEVKFFRLNGGITGSSRAISQNDGEAGAEEIIEEITDDAVDGKAKG